MFTIDDTRIGADELIERVRDEVRRRQLAGVPPPDVVVDLGLRPSDDGAAAWATVHRAISVASWNERVGMELPPMSQMRGWRRWIAVPVARVILRAAALVTRQQTSFNVETIRALRAVADAMVQQLGILERQQAEARHDTQRRHAALAEATERTGDQLLALERAVAVASADATTRIEAVVRRGEEAAARLRTQLVLQEQRLARLGDALRRGAPATEVARVTIDEAVHVHDDFYVRFEERFRGAREDIIDRARGHLETIRASGAGTAERPVLDLACGRGEWLELLREQGLDARGVDSNRVLVADTQARGLDVVEADALAYLRAIPDRSCGAVTAFHFLEHLPFAEILELIEEVVRVLRPDGVAIFESPNAGNVFVGACAFRVDPTHRTPLYPHTLAFVCEARGLTRVRAELLHPMPESEWLPNDGSPVTNRLNNLLYDAQDFAVVGYRPSADSE
jgi:O-antigen chain-terminating methyltransferase